ncbi:MAG: DinB family protein [Longimicrobiales bacterium]
MAQRRIWFDRKFELGLPIQAFPDILERVRGTPGRLEERLHGHAQQILVHRIDNAWSIQENAGHLLDLESLWKTRIDQLLAGTPQLQPADLQNRRTHEANHNARAVAEILTAFRRARSAIISRLEAMTPLQLSAQALHPRLQQPMTAVDLSFFVAEHDDHHLARITQILKHINGLKG